jgi:hypothetical protein
MRTCTPRSLRIYVSTIRTCGTDLAPVDTGSDKPTKLGLLSAYFTLTWSRRRWAKKRRKFHSLTGAKTRARSRDCAEIVSFWPGPHQNRQAQSRPRSPGRKKEEDHRNDESNGHRHDRKSRPAPVRGYMPVSGIESEILSRRLPNIHREAQASHTIQDKACTNIREHCKNHRNCEEADSGSHEEVPQHDHILLPNRPRHSPVKYHPKEGKL